MRMDFQQGGTNYDDYKEIGLCCIRKTWTSHLQLSGSSSGISDREQQALRQLTQLNDFYYKMSHCVFELY